SVNLQKQENMMVVQFHIRGTVNLVCDVCLTTFPAETVIDEQLIVKFTDEDLTETTDEILVLSRRDYELDIAPVLYEFINVSTPPYIKCSEQGNDITCDETVLAKLNELSPEQQEVTETDPRWEALKNIKYNKN